MWDVATCSMDGSLPDRSRLFFSAVSALSSSATSCLMKERYKEEDMPRASKSELAT